LIQFREVTAEPIEQGEVLVAWELRPLGTGEDIAGSFFVIQRSGGLAGPYLTISGQIDDANTYVDRALPRKHQNRKLTYRVLLQRVNPATNLIETLADSLPVTINPDPDLLALEIVRQFRVLHRRATGTLCAIFSIRDFGHRCPVCFNETQMRSTRSNCAACFSTGFLGGYFAQVNAFVDFEPTKEAVQITQFGEFQENDTVVWITNYPPVKPRDVVVDQMSRRWKVVSVRRIERLGFVVQQFMQLRIIQKVDIEQSIPVAPLVPPEDVFLGHGRIGGSLLC
jgi:hypothetical protein